MNKERDNMRIIKEVYGCILTWIELKMDIERD